MKPFLLPSLLVFVLASCDGSKEALQAQVAEAKVAEESAPSESVKRRRVREILETVVLPKVDFSQTSAEEGSDYVQFWIKEISPAKAVKIVVRRPMPLDDDGRPITGGEVCYSGHTWKAENISAWKALERIADDNRMTVEADEKGVQLMPRAEDGKPVMLRPLEEE